MVLRNSSQSLHTRYVLCSVWLLDQLFRPLDSKRRHLKGHVYVAFMSFDVPLVIYHYFDHILELLKGFLAKMS